MCVQESKTNNRNTIFTGSCMFFFVLFLFGRICTECSKKYLDSSIEAVAFQVYEILKIDHELLQFF